MEETVLWSLHHNITGFNFMKAMGKLQYLFQRKKPRSLDICQLIKTEFIAGSWQAESNVFYLPFKCVLFGLHNIQGFKL